MATGLKAMLLAAGRGSRLWPLTDVLPKCLMPINGRPLLEYWLRLLLDGGVTEVVLNLHHHANLVREYIRRSPFAQFVTLSYEEHLLGTGGTLLRNRALFAGVPVLCAHADNLTLFDPREFFAAHRGRPPEAIMTMMTFATDTPANCGIVERNARGLVTAFHEKSPSPPGNLANAAIYILEPEVLEFLESLGKPIIDFSTEIIPRFLGRIHTFLNDEYHRDVGTLMSLSQAQFDYPCIAAIRATSRSAAVSDPWFGMMTAENGRLAHDFALSVEKAFAVASQDKR